tara:strand:- start:2026 stop:2955 length:930 start_codon:yes stop_codon:yes gene_type:complete
MTKLIQQLTIISVLLLVFSCTEGKPKNTATNLDEYKLIITDDYELHQPNQHAEAVLILFGGFPEEAIDIKREFKILDKAKKHKIAIVFSNYNQKLWLEKKDAKQLATQLQQIVDSNKLPNEKIYFGGFSSGGNIAMLIGDYLIENSKIEINPKGIFIVDSPIDLAELYLSSLNNIAQNFSDVSIQESNWLISSLGKRFGDPNEMLSEYEKYSVFTSKTKNISNIQNLKNIKIRMYSEPDTTWWKENRMTEYEHTNAYHIKNLSEKLKQNDFTNVEYITTKKRGYRANGERHPHSWAIVETEELIDWILK